MPLPPQFLKKPAAPVGKFSGIGPTLATPPKPGKPAMKETPAQEAKDMRDLSAILKANGVDSATIPTIITQYKARDSASD